MKAAEGRDEEARESDWGVDATDAEGWTALHSACSRGYLDIVKLLVEPERYLRPASSPSSSSCSSALYNGKPRSDSVSDSVSVSVSPGESRSASRSASSSSLLPQPPSALSPSPISAPPLPLPLPRGASIHLPGGGARGLFSPLMNAAAKGHLSLVLYLLHKRRADPFQRNAHGETALDVAAASFEVHLARDVLGREERRRWDHDMDHDLEQGQDDLEQGQDQLTGAEGDDAAKGPKTAAESKAKGKGKGAYNPLRLHSTLPVVLHENQRLDSRLPTLLSSSASASQHRGASSSSASDPTSAGTGAPRWSHQYAARATKRDRRPPGSLPAGGPLPGGLALDLVTGSAPFTVAGAPASASAGSAASSRISSSQNRRGAAAATAAATMARAVSDPSMLAVFREDVALPTRAEPYKLGIARGHGHGCGREQEHGHGHGRGGEQLSDAAADLASTPTPASTLLKQKQRAHPLPHPHSDPASTPGSSSDDDPSEPTHFWLSDWQVDRTHPRVDVQSGWSYATSFDAPEDQWYASPPAALQSLLEGRSGWGARVSKALTGSGAGSGSGSGIGDGNGQGKEEQQQQQPDQLSWVRRRRWVRVMRRRLDLDFDDELARLEAASALGGVARFTNNNDSTNGAALPGQNGDDAQEAAQQDAQAIVDEARRAAREDAGKLGESAEYVERAAAIAGVRPDAKLPAVASLSEHADVGDDDAGSRANESESEGDARMEELLRRITRLTLAIEEIRGHAFVDQDVVRRARAEDLLKGYTMQLGQLRRAAKLDLDDEEEDGRGEHIRPMGRYDNEHVPPQFALADVLALKTMATQMLTTMTRRKSSSTPTRTRTTAPRSSLASPHATQAAQPPCRSGPSCRSGSRAPPTSWAPSACRPMRAPRPRSCAAPTWRARATSVSRRAIRATPWSTRAASGRGSSSRTSRRSGRAIRASRSAVLARASLPSSYAR